MQTFRCCSDVSYFPWLGYDASLAFNSTTWYGYALGFGVWKYDVQVALSQGSFFTPPRTRPTAHARTWGQLVTIERSIVLLQARSTRAFSSIRSHRAPP
jgi:hypothetical protein